MAEIVEENIIKNETEKSLLRFEASRIFNRAEWLLDDEPDDHPNDHPDDEHDDDKIMAMLENQLRYAGGFFKQMELIDLDTPPRVRLNLERLVNILNHKTTKRVVPITKVEKVVLPNLGTLLSSTQVRDVLKSVFDALGGKSDPVVVDTLTVPCDDVSNEFCNDDLAWIEQFCSRHSVNTITIKVVNKGKAVESFKEFKAKFCGEDRFGGYSPTDFLSSPTKRSRTAPQPRDINKRRREASPIEEFDEIKCNNISKDRLPSTSILNECWKVDKLHKHITGKEVTIAFLDSGININHEAFAGRIVAVNDIKGDGTIDLTTDSFGHGTMCAFVACGASFKATGRRENLQVPAGVAPGARIVMYRITNDSGRAHTDAITKALRKCAEDKERHGIDIVLLPYGSDYHDLDQADAILALIRKDVLVVTASGNNGCKNDVSYPARLGFTICIGSHDMHYHTMNYTSKGHALDYTAPGEYLAGACSKHPSAFTIERGTSYAAASVAGLLALIIEHVKKVAPNGSRQPPLTKLVHNQFVMKGVLRSISRYHTKHDENYGYGHLDPTEIFSKKKKELENLFYKDILDDKSKSSI